MQSFGMRQKNIFQKSNGDFYFSKHLLIPRSLHLAKLLVLKPKIGIRVSLQSVFDWVILKRLNVPPNSHSPGLKDNNAGRIP